MQIPDPDRSPLEPDGDGPGARSRDRACVQTVRGPVAASELGLALPHEHLFSALPAALGAPHFDHTADLPGAAATAERQWQLRVDPYANGDNLGPKDFDDVRQEVELFAGLGGRTIVDVTGSAATGRDPGALLRMSEATGTHIVMATGSYIERVERPTAARAIEAVADAMVADLTVGARAGGARTGIRAGIIGEVGVSPDFTRYERESLLAAALAHRRHPAVAVMVHLPGWRRLGHEVVDVLVAEGVPVDRIVLAHMDPSGSDPAYQRSLAERGVWLEFDMIGMGISFPGEGRAPDPAETARAIGALVRGGYSGRLLLSHDLFLKQMWAGRGGGGLVYVLTAFREVLEEFGVDADTHARMLRANPAAMLAG